MKQLLEFLKSTAVGGLFFVLPLILILFLVREAVGGLSHFLAPIAALLPSDLLGQDTATLAALLLLLSVSFVLGLALRTRLGTSLGRWLEEKVLYRIPGYKLLRILSSQISGKEAEEQFAPAVVRMGPDTLVFAYIIEEHETDYCTVLLPAAPGGTAGPLQYIPADRVTRLAAPLGKVFGCVSNYGVGAGQFFVPHTPPKGS